MVLTPVFKLVFLSVLGLSLLLFGFNVFLVEYHANPSEEGETAD